MAANIITQEDLDLFKIEFFEEQKQLLQQFKEDLNGKSNQFKVDTNGIRWIKSHQVQRMLSISPGTLQTLRINGTMPYSKIGGSIFYAFDDVQNLLTSNKRNVR